MGEFQICDQPGSPNAGATPKEGGGVVEGLALPAGPVLAPRNKAYSAGICHMYVRECIVALRQAAVQMSQSVWHDASTLPSRDPVDLVGQCLTEEQPATSTATGSTRSRRVARTHWQRSPACPRRRTNGHRHPLAWPGPQLKARCKPAQLPSYYLPLPGEGLELKHCTSDMG